MLGDQKATETHPSQTVIKLGKTVVSSYDTYKQSDDEANTQHLLAKLRWDEIQASIHFFADNCDRFAPTVRDLLEAQLQVLVKKLEVVLLKQQKTIPATDRLSRLRYAVTSKQTLEDLIEDVETWQTRFLQYLQLIVFSGYGLETRPPEQETRALSVIARLQDVFRAAAAGDQTTPGQSAPSMKLPPSVIPADAEIQRLRRSTVYTMSSPSQNVDLIISTLR